VASGSRRPYLPAERPSPSHSDQVACHGLRSGHRAEASDSKSLLLGPGTTDVAMSLALPDPKLWGIDHPNVYRLSVQVAKSNSEPLDEQTDTFGVRTFEIRDRHLLINDEASSPDRNRAARRLSLGRAGETGARCNTTTTTARPAYTLTRRYTTRRTVHSRLCGPAMEWCSFRKFRVEFTEAQLSDRRCWRWPNQQIGPR